MNDSELKKCINNPDYIIKKYFHNHKFCMAYNKTACNGDICEAHVISKKFLKNIPENGHVYIPAESFHHKNGFYEFKMRGIQKATRITGFCSHHDNDLFESFEKNEFKGDYSQIYDLTFRALCREYFQKKCSLSFINQFKNGKLNIFDRNNYTKSEDFKLRRSNLENQLRDHRFLYEQLENKKKSGLSFSLIETSKLPFATTGVMTPLYYPDETKVQKAGRKQHGFIYNLIPANERSYIVIASVNSLHNNIHKEFLLKISDAKEAAVSINYLLNYFFLNNDNIVLNPSWLNQLNDECKNKLIKLLNTIPNSEGKNYWHEGINFFHFIENFKFFKIIRSIK